LGHERIGFAGEALTAAKLDMFKRAMRRAGLPIYDAYVKISNERFERAGSSIAREWIAENDVPTAIIAAYDYMAIGVIKALRKQGYYSMIKDEDLVAIISERRKKDANYLIEGLAEERDKLNTERYKQLEVIWNTQRFDLNLEQVDKLIDEIWCGDMVGADEAKEHYRDLYFSKLGLSRIYGQWKEPRKSRRRKFARERELIDLYEGIAMRDAVEAAREKEFTLPECEARMDDLSKIDQITVQSISKIIQMRAEIERLRSENDLLKNMVSAAVN